MSLLDAYWVARAVASSHTVLTINSSPGIHLESLKGLGIGFWNSKLIMK